MALGAAALLLVFVVFFIAGAGSHHLRRWVTDFTYIPIAVASAVLALRASRHRALDSRTRTAWRLVAAACACKVFADTVWWWLDALHSTPAPFPSVADIGFLAFIPTLLTGLLLFPGRPLNRRARLRLALDAGTVVAGGFMVLWYLVLGPTVEAGGVDPLTAATSVAYPIGDLVLLVGVAALLLRQPIRSSRMPLKILLAAVVVEIVADVDYAYVGLHQGFIGGTWPDLLFLSATLLLGVSAAEQYRRANNVREAETRSAARGRVSWLPYVAIVIGYGLLLYLARGTRLYPLGGLILGAVILTALVVLRQVTVLRENERLLKQIDASVAELTQRATHDSLTGLANRAALVERLSASFGPGRDRRKRHDDVLLIDVDDFKEVNDTLGHEGGDTLLVELAERLRQCVRHEDLVGRLGGDEFAIVVQDGDGGSVTPGVARRVLEMLEVPFTVLGVTMPVSVSIGVAQRHPDTADGDELLRQADFAMYTAKRAGKQRCETFDAETHDAIAAQTALKHDLERAVSDGQLRLDYQPIFDLSTGRVVGSEALVRWQHPRLGLLGPDAFIPLAEETGAIDTIGAWVLGAAARQIAVWRAQFPASPDLWVAVNVSSLQLRSPDRVAAIWAAIEGAAVDPASIVLEITESALTFDSEASVAGLERMRCLGVRIAIDDFGRGFSSLSRLAGMPVDILKIDRSFVSGNDSQKAEPVLDAIVGLAHNVGLVVIAEGIEEPCQLDMVQRLGCEMGQGFLLTRPVAASEIESVLASDLTISVPIPPDRNEDIPHRPAIAPLIS